MTVADPERPEKLVLQLLATAGPEAKEEIVSVADYLEERGRQKGLEEGRQAGGQEALQRTLLKLLDQRFGALPSAIRKRIQDADTKLLDAWIDRVLTAASLDEALAEG